MRIGIDATTLYTIKPTGLGVFAVNVINELARIHDDIVIWTVHDEIFQVPRDKIRKVLRPWQSLSDSLYMLRRPLWVEFVLPSLLKKEMVDVLYATEPSEMLNCPIPQVVTVHDLFPITFPEDSSFPVRWNYKNRIPRILRNASAIIAPSNYTKNEIIDKFKLFPGQIHVVHEGYDKNNFFRREDASCLQKYGLSRTKYILSIGNARRRKNQERLIRAYASVKGMIPHKLALVGQKGSADVRKLQALIRGHNLEDSVVLIDYVPYHELPVFYSGADLFVYISLGEGFGLPVLEAMACGTPVLASNTTSILEVAGDAAVLADPLNDDAIGDLMVKTISNPVLQQKLSISGLNRCKMFSWEKAARGILSILKDQAA